LDHGDANFKPVLWELASANWVQNLRAVQKKEAIPFPMSERVACRFAARSQKIFRIVVGITLPMAMPGWGFILFEQPCLTMQRRTGSPKTQISFPSFGHVHNPPKA
jgi:hypothetical protein